MTFTLLTHFQLMAGYNRRLNQQIYSTAATLSDEERKKDRAAFFQSIHQTLNHLMVGDIVWLRRFRNHRDYYKALDILEEFPIPKALNEVLFDSFSTLQSKREQLDEAIIQWLSTDTNSNDFDDHLKYKNMLGTPSHRNFGEVLMHFFNHQTHHRGQVSTLLSQCGLDIGVTDFLIDVPDEINS